MTRRKRRNHSSAFKAKVALAALKGERTVAELADQFIASYAKPPAVIVLDMDHTDDATHGQQEFNLYNHHYRHHCYLPLLVFEGLSGRFITAALRPGKRPTGAENAAIIARILRRLRGDGHFANPELMALSADDPHTDFVFGLTGNAVLTRLAEAPLAATRALHGRRCADARHNASRPPARTRTYHELDYAARSWARPARVILKAEVTALGDNPRYVATSLDLPSPEALYRDLYCARGQDENFIKMMKNDLACDRTSSPRFLANQMRLFFAAAYVLHHSLRTETLAYTEFAGAQPATVITKLFKIAVRVVVYRDRVKLHLPSTSPVKALLQRVTEILHRCRPPPRGQPA